MRRVMILLAVCAARGAARLRFRFEGLVDDVDPATHGAGCSCEDFELWRDTALYYKDLADALRANARIKDAARETTTAPPTGFPTHSLACYAEYASRTFGYSLAFRVCSEDAVFMTASHYASDRSLWFTFHGPCARTGALMTAEACLAAAGCSTVDWLEVGTVFECPSAAA